MVHPNRTINETDTKETTTVMRCRYCKREGDTPCCSDCWDLRDWTIQALERADEALLNLNKPLLRQRVIEVMVELERERQRDKQAEPSMIQACAIRKGADTKARDE